MSDNNIPANYLVFDDDDDALDQYKLKVKIEGYDCNPIYINPANFVDPENGNFKVEEFKIEIIERTNGVNICLILTDWNMSLPDIFGWDIIEYCIDAKNKLKDKQFFIYSSDIQRASKYILEKIKTEVCDKTDAIDDLSLHTFVSNILDLKVKFWKRDGTQFSEIITLLKKESKTISNVVLNSVQNFDEMLIVNTGNDDFDGKTIGDILNNIEDNGIGLRFVKEIVELSVSHYTELNEGL